MSQFESEVPCKSRNIWRALMADADFQSGILFDEQRELYRQLVDRLPSVLADFLDEPVALVPLWKARLAFAQHLQMTEFMARLFSAIAPVLVAAGLPDGTQLAEAKLASIIETIELFLGCEDMMSALTEGGRVEEQVLFDLERHACLREDLREPYRRGELTIGRLLVTQPMAIFSLVAIELLPRDAG